MIRIGHGFDVHKFGGIGPIKICGESVPFNQGLVAHSDGDVALHALIDAMLGALALGDIGTIFPDSNLFFKNIDSQKLLRIVYFEKILKKRYIINNIDITIIAQVPKMSAYVKNMRKNIGDCLNCDRDCISIKFTSTEKLGFIGRKEGIACEAVVLLIQK